MRIPAGNKVDPVIMIDCCRTSSILCHVTQNMGGGKPLRQCYKQVPGILLCCLGTAVSVQAQSMPGYTLQETVLVPVTGAAASSQTTLLQGVDYQLKAVGTAQVQVPIFFGFGAFYRQADAEYAFDSSFFLFFLAANSCFSEGRVDIGLAVNNSANGASKTPFWGAYNSAHTYTAKFTGAGAPISINYHNCQYAGSHGLLTVQIFRPMGMNLLETGPPSYTDVSPGLQTFVSTTDQSASGRANALAVATNGTRLYAGTFAGVWRSDDAGLTWRQMTNPQPPGNVDAVTGALFAPDVYDIAVSPQNPDVVMIGVKSDLHTQAMNGIYRSEDGGNNWTLVKSFDCSSGGPVTQIVFAPDDANLLYAAGDCAAAVSHDGGKTWSEKVLPGNDPVWHIAVAPFEPPVYKNAVVSGIGGGPSFGVRRVYALGSNEMSYSMDGGQTWTEDTGINAIVHLTGVGGAATTNSGNSSRVLIVEPGNNQRVLLAVPALSNGPSYYDNPSCGASATVADGTICNANPSVRGCGEGSLWRGDFSGFVTSDPTRQAAAWTQLPSPPTYWGVTTPSGNSYLNLRAVGSNYLLFFSDKSHVHVSMGLPTAGGWHRLEGLDASQTAPPHPPNPYCNNLFVHPDPHAIVTTTNFSMTLQAPPAKTPAPYNENKVAGPVSSGDIWMANDGGVYHATGASGKWEAAGGLSTLAAINVAGVAIKGYGPALYFGNGDNGNFYSLDGGSSWKSPRSACGDCDAWVADPAQVQQVAAFMPYADGGGFYVFTNSAKYPDAKPADGTIFAHWVCPSDCNVSSSYWIRGYRPVVMTPAGSVAPATGDYLVIGTKSDGSRVVFRKTNAAAMNATSDWENTANAVQYGPTLPACAQTPNCIDVVQASGGHAAPVLFAGDPDAGVGGDLASHELTLWKWTPGTANWEQIVPSTTATKARRFYVDPYNPNTIYLLDNLAVKRSDDGGATWAVDASLDNAVTENHRYSYTGDFSVLKDIIFTRGEDGTRFAVGNAGVFYTLDGRNWRRLLSTSALPSHPVAAYFDNISDPCDRALYVALAGRGLLRIDPIPVRGLAIYEACPNQVVNKTKE